MTEQEIIEYLKENRNKGVACRFMPNEVHKWCKKHRAEKIFLLLTEKYGWTKPISFICSDVSVYALPDSYEINPKFKPYWEEFYINEKGSFVYKDKEYLWLETDDFLKDNKDEFNNFGGWCFINSKDDDLIWTTDKPLINKWNEFTTTCTNSEHKEMKSIIPIKISFWRIKE